MNSAETLIEAFSRGVVKALLEAGRIAETKPRTKTRRKSIPRTRTSTNLQQELPIDADKVADVFPVVQAKRDPAVPPSPEELDAIIRGMTPEDIEAALRGTFPAGTRVPGEGEYVGD